MLTGSMRRPEGGPMTTTTAIQRGVSLMVRDASGIEHPMTADSGIETVGHDFPVVWVRRPLRDGGQDRVPWPADDVRPA